MQGEGKEASPKESTMKNVIGIICVHVCVSVHTCICVPLHMHRGSHFTM